jgi:hypothetical protein
MCFWWRGGKQTKTHSGSSSATSLRTSHCLALKNVDGPTGGPRRGGTMMRRLPPGRIVRMPSSKPVLVLVLVWGWGLGGA